MFTAPATGSDTSQMREFLAHALAWPQEHDQQPSFVNVHHVMRLTNDDGTPMLTSKGKQAIAVPGRACRNVDEAVRNIEWAVSKQTDVYVCMSSQRAAEETISRRGFKYFKALRRLDNVAAHKSFYIDVDVKPEDLAHGYASPEEAVNEFVRIRTELNLPRQTFVVQSGSGGFHAHWCLSEPMTTGEWRVLSAALAAGFLAKGFRGDTQCIVDAVRLLRPPDTFNFKQRETPRRVTFLGRSGFVHPADSLRTALAQYVGMMRPAPVLNGTGAAINGTVNGFGPLGPRAKVFDGVTSEGFTAGLDAGMESLLPTLAEVALGCPFVYRTIMEGGRSNSNPLWLQTTNLALFVQKSRAMAHKMSDGHATYSKGETDALFDRQQATRRGRDLGWPRCATIASYGAPECATCLNRPLSRSPLNFALGRAQQAAPPGPGSAVQPQAAPAVVATSAPIVVGVSSALADLPSLYAYDQLNRICRESVDEKGNQTYEPLCNFVMERPWLQGQPPSLNFTTYTSQGIQAQIRLPFEVINDLSQFKRTLGKQGMVPHKHEVDDLGEFFVSWIDKLRADRSNVIQNQSFGWAVKGGKIEGFVYGGYLWNAGVPRPAANIDQVLSSQYSPVGELQPWLDAAKLITNQQRPALDAILASAFAAPLVRFTGQAGVLLSTYSMRSGIGKSTALKVAQAVWGNPVKAVQSLSDTQNSVLKKMGDTKNLPLFWDELKTRDDTHKFANLAFQLSLGKEKSRLSADTSYRDPGTWQTLMCSTSNDSILAYVLSQLKTSTAGLYRIFEYEVPVGVTGQISTAEASLMVAALNDNFGQAGLMYSQFLGTQHERIAKEVEAYSKSLEAHYKIQSDERFWLALVVTIIMGAVYANEVGLTAIDIDKLTRFMVEKFQRMRNERTTSEVDIHLDANVLGIVSRYLNEHRQSHTLVTNIMWRGSGRPALGVLKLDGSDTNKIRSVRIHHASDDKIVRFIKGPWDDWLTEKGLTPSLINKELIEKFHAQTSRHRLGAGTMLVTSSELCLEIKYDDPVFAGFFDL